MSDPPSSPATTPAGGDPPRDQHADVRMRGFTQRVTVAAALRWVDAQTVVPLGEEIVPLADSAGRVLAREMVSPVDVPGFNRAMMDGFAVCAADTAGASVYNRLPIQVTGQVLPGQPTTAVVTRGRSIRIMTGAPLPAGADAILPAEKVEMEGMRILALDEVPPGKHVGRRGEDIAAETVVLHRGRRLRPQDLGVLSSIGCATVPVVRRPLVRLVITGNELLPAGTLPHDALIADANGPMLTSLVHRDGGQPIHPGIVPDRHEAILAALTATADVLLVSGGSSVGQEDLAPMLLSQHGNLAIHGIAMRPSSPTGMGTLGERLVFLLPGNPVSCLCAYDLFAGRAIRALAGLRRDWPYHSVRLPLGRKLVSTVGRLDYARVRIVDGRVEPLAISGASLLTSTTRADGFVLIPEDSEGYPPNTLVAVYLYDGPPSSPCLSSNNSWM